MQKKIYLVILAVVALAMQSCGLFGGGDDTTTIKESDLIGRWEAQSQASYATEGQKIVFVFLSDKCVKDSTDYGKWGYTFDEADDVHESDLMPNDSTEESDYHGNGWFGWKLENKTIQTYQMFTSSDAVSPYAYTISSLSGSTMVMTEGRKTYTLTKVNQ